MRRKSTRVFHSTFVTEETRQTYKEKEQIIAILSENKDKFITCKKIVKIGASRGWTTPLVDDERLAMAHPYWRVLTSITCEGTGLYANNVIEATNTDGILCYKLSTTHHFEEDMFIRNECMVKNGKVYKKRAAKFSY